MPEQLSKEDVRELYRRGKPEEIVKALREGRLETLMGREPRYVPDPDLGEEIQLTKAQLLKLTPDEIMQAKAAGQLDDLLSGKPEV